MTGTRPFRFGVVATPHGGAERWRATAQRVAELGYSTLLMPDGLQLLSPVAALAVAATAADIRVGTFVLAGPLRPPRTAAWEGHSLSVLTDGRFDFGIGTGRPGVEQFTHELGLPYGSASERLAQVVAAIDHLRELDGPDRSTPVLMAAGGPKARAIAAQKADIVTLAMNAASSREVLDAAAGDLWAQAGERADDIELAMNLFVVGDEVPPHAERYIGADAATLIATDSLVMLRGNAAQMADELQRRRERFGTSYIAVNVEYLEKLGPVVEALAGR